MNLFLVFSSYVKDNGISKALVTAGADVNLQVQFLMSYRSIFHSKL